MFVEEHNHILATPRKCHLLPSHRKIDESQIGLIDKMSQSSIRTNLMMKYFSEESQGSQNVGFIELDARNYMRTRRKIEFSVGDSQWLLDYMNSMQIKNPHFFYVIQLNVDGKLTSIFWSDARCRMDYSYFGDVVCLDPTYGINKYGMPFIPIVGVNHHLQTILFGCALVLDETEYLFIWVLENWLQAMKGCHPKVILTDQDSAITGAIAQVLPRTIHRYCLWHSFQNAKRNLSKLFKRGSKFGKDLSYCARFLETIEDFEIKWNELLAKYDLKENDWMLRMYRKRQQWVPVYSRDFFCAYMSTTQRSESINKFFKWFLSKIMMLMDFVQGVEKALIKSQEKEIETDFKMNNVHPYLMLHMPIEEEASKLYTPAMFTKFQEELLGSLCYRCEKIEDNEGIAIYKYWILERDVKLVKICFASSLLVSCTCYKFEFTRLLCRHILKVFIVANVDNIPSEYKLKCWTRDAKYGKVFDENDQRIEEDCQAHLTLRYSSLSHKASKIATKGSCSIEVYKVVMH
ncbi:FHY3/FAR1 family protein [Dioscorea alata]|uniref:FHY3/FAR1 family protein n=1 Tax=Dioscorea alata TaxID=55571 RepID=A0ACB7VQU9_DIOAL|nr:FHY3/FAR1 family protein [Dioscorea alata]